MKDRNTLFTAILVALGCFVLPSATQAVPLPPAPTNVNVVNTPNVNVANTTASPVLMRDVDNPARQPFQAQVLGGFADGAPTTGDITIAIVPAGKRLVIEQVSAFATMIPGQNLIRGTIQPAGVPVVKVEFQWDRHGNNSAGSSCWIISSGLVRVYSDPGPVQCSAERDSFAGPNPDSVTFTIIGYLVDCPTCVP